MNWKWILAAMGIALAGAMMFSYDVLRIVLLVMLTAATILVPLGILAAFGYCVYRGFRRHGKRAA